MGESLANLPAGTRTWFHQELFAAKHTHIVLEKKNENVNTSRDRFLLNLQDLQAQTNLSPNPPLGPPPWTPPCVEREKEGARPPCVDVKH